MPHYGFIDESGTLQEHEVLTVALVVLDGARVADKLHLKVSKSVFTPPKTRGLAEKEKWFAAQKLHFADMDERQKLAMGAELAKANIAAVITNYWHTDESTSHEHRFAMYRSLVKATINKAFESFDDLMISVSKQGGWESYGPSFLQELRLLPDEFTKRGDYRKGYFFLSSAAKPGQQIADYFASSSRNFLLAKSDASLSSPYECVQHQVRHFEEMKAVAELLAKEK